MNLRCVNKFLSRRISLSSSCPKSREGLDVSGDDWATCEIGKGGGRG